MREIFADTSYWWALFDRTDAYHELAKEIGRDLKGVQIVTTEEILGETLNLVASRHGSYGRQLGLTVVSTIMKDANVFVIHQTHESFSNGLLLFGERLDKDYSFHDCVSMHVCKERQITEVLTTDHHFEQEGLIALLLGSSSENMPSSRREERSDEVK